MMLPFVALALFSALQTPTAAGQDLTLPPETAHLLSILEGRGVQIYTCAATAGRTPEWVLTAPDAELFNLATGKPAGHHGAGPTWTLDDGRVVHGTPLQRKPADNPGDVPWLLLSAETTPAQTGTAPMITFVRRYNTHGGAAPRTACDTQHAGTTLRVPYSAHYAFYGSGL